MNSFIILCGFLVTVLAAPEPPYPAKGWRPNGQQFNLPQKYGAPSQTYGPAEETTETSTTTEQSTEAEENSGNGKFQKQRYTNRFSSRLTQSTGQYFVITPEGRLQHVSIPTNQGNRRDTELDEDVEVRQTPLGRLVQLPITNEQLRQQEKIQNPENPTEYFALTQDGRLQRIQPGQAQQSQQAFQFVQVSQPAAQPAQTTQNEQRNQLLVVLPKEGSTKQPANQQQENGQYHVLLPSGKLQRVQYMNVLTPDNRLSSNAEYREVDPIPGPLYTFGAPLVRVA